MTCSRFLLSICIPTFNRDSLLRETLKSLTSQLDPALHGRVEIVISDNSSTDDTATVIQDLRNEWQNVTSFCWPENMGPDLNYLKVIDLAQGEYCWFLGSDDVVCDGSLRRVLSELEHKPDVLLFDRFESDATLTAAPVAGSWSDLPDSFSCDTAKEPDEFHLYLEKCKDLGGLFSFLSVIVFRRDRWESIPSKDRFVGSAYVHVHALFAILAEGARFRFLKEPLVLCRLGNDSFCPDSGDPAQRYRRVKLDIDGYLTISRHVFGSDSPEHRMVLRLVHRITTFGLVKQLMSRFLHQGNQGDCQRLKHLLAASGMTWKSLSVQPVSCRYVRLSLLWLAVMRLFDNMRKVFAKYSS
ncbi:glycosyltransferase, putative [Citrifermentans bemidjiense Bem]|uniref:Glycosyltransferase, putative n=1 Tax=Citrifermentans bemidjiense (strain ATCC BAA-1014 / DSM 16622 / JCM 12645 / Bem) TaxID=404380 RepID=B5EEY1_CITBB|nr:glycosyltransferase family 2 protein [Citrifermentans bemidjiense]ACH37877.1 glycosyltransferase, putative [Citrifermentans bemidjiense Bem]